MAQIAILNKYRNELGRAYRKMYDNGTRSEQRKELWRKEQLRAFYGLERKTNLHIPPLRYRTVHPPTSTP